MISCDHTSVTHNEWQLTVVTSKRFSCKTKLTWILMNSWFGNKFRSFYTKWLCTVADLFSHVRLHMRPNLQKLPISHNWFCAGNCWSLENWLSIFLNYILYPPSGWRVVIVDTLFLYAQHLVSPTRVAIDCIQWRCAHMILMLLWQRRLVDQRLKVSVGVSV